MRKPGELRVRPVEGRRDLKRFIRVPDTSFRDDPAWVRPFVMERLALLDPNKNPYFDHSEAVYWIAEREGLPVGRISAQIDRFVEERTGERIGHFGNFDSFDDTETAAALFETAEGWLKQCGCTKVQGPFNLSINGECGLLVDGFETPPTLMMDHARPYHGALVEARGYAKARDMYAYELDLLKGPPERITRFVEASKCKPEYRLRRIDMRHYEDELSTIIDIFNDAWANNWGFVPLTKAEARHMAKEIKPLVDPCGVQICEYDSQPMAMMVTLFDFNSLTDDLGGRLFPTGWAKLGARLLGLHLRGRVPQRLRVPLMGVRSQFQNTRRGAAMALMLIESIRQACVDAGANWAELSWILEDNTGMRDILDEIGATIYKTYRVYEKALA